MDIGERINRYRRQAGLTIDELASASGVSRGTLNKIIGGETKSPTVAVMGKLARALGRSLDDFDEQSQRASALSDQAVDVARDFDALDDHGQRVVRAVVGEEKRRVTAERERADQTAGSAEKPQGKIIPLFGNAFAAGLGEPDFDNLWTEYEAPADSPAEFAVRINGNSMEPYLHDGSVALGQKRTPRDGEVAALLLDGEFLCKQVCQDSVGNVYLFALNRDRKDADVTIDHDAERSLTCFGTILMGPVPLPTDV